MALVETNKRLYELQYCPERDLYFDHPPIKKSERNITEFYCPCKCNSSFNSYSSWMRHINLKVHKDYKENYKFLIAPLLSARSEITDLKREKHSDHNKYKSLKLKYRKLQLELENSKQIENEYEMLKIEYKNIKKELENAKQDLDEINNLIISESDDDFVDCN